MCELDIKVIRNDDRKYVLQCLEIFRENHVNNGGMLKNMLAVLMSDYIVCALKDDKVVGYLVLVEDHVKENDVFFEQLAVKKSEQHKGIGTTLVEYVKNHSLNYSYITSNVRGDNDASNNLHLKMGFEQARRGVYDYVYTLSTDKLQDRLPLQLTEEIEPELE